MHMSHYFLNIYFYKKFIYLWNLILHKIIKKEIIWKMYDLNSFSYSNEDFISFIYRLVGQVNNWFNVTISIRQIEFSENQLNRYRGI